MAEFRLVEGQGDDPCADVIGDTVPHPIRPRAAIVQRLWPTGLILIVSIDRTSISGFRFALACDEPASGIVDQPDDL